MKDKAALVILKPGVPLDPQKFRAAIKKGGYEVRDFEIVLRGKVERSSEGFELKPEGTAQSFVMRSAAAAKQLEPWVGKVVRVRGRVTAEAPRIELELIEVASPGG